MLIYEIYIKTFKKSCDQDQFGCINGIIKQAPYLKQLGVDAIWITPFYPSPLIDNGYDVASYTEVDERLGSIEDFKRLIATYHQLGIKVFIDVVFNHTSDQHQWFLNAISGDVKYQDYYLFADKPVNNWESMFKGSAWSYVKSIDKYYLHRFAKEQPDLNYMHDNVLLEVKEVLKYWMEIGVDGFRFDVINFLITDKELYHLDNDEGSRNDLNMPGTYEVIKKLKTYVKSINKDITFIGEIGSDDIQVLNSYIGDDLMDFVFTFNVSSIEKLDINKLGFELVNTYELIEHPTIFFSSHDMSRFFRRLAGYDSELHLMLMKLMFTLKGIKILYQGDENQTRDFECENIESMNDIQSKNEYYQLINQGIEEAEAFKMAMKNNRDYSRNFINFTENEAQLNKAKKIITSYNNDFYTYAAITDINYNDTTISFIRSDEFKSIKFEFDFKNKTIKEDDEYNI